MAWSLDIAELVVVPKPSFWKPRTFTYRTLVTERLPVETPILLGPTLVKRCRELLRQHPCPFTSFELHVAADRNGAWIPVDLQNGRLVSDGTTHIYEEVMVQYDHGHHMRRDRELRAFFVQPRLLLVLKAATAR